MAVLAGAALACGRPTMVAPSSPATVAVVDTGVSRIGPLAPVLDPGDRLTVIPDQGVDDVDGHGTRVAWLVHWRSPTTRLLSVKAIGKGGHVTDEDLAEAVRRAVERRARIVLLPMSGAAPLPRTRAAILEAGRDDVLVVVAAGNDGLDLDEHPAYPAAYAEANMVVVIATDGSGRPLGTSNRNASATACARAPGLRMATCEWDGRPATIGGTSAASALVAGRAAELLATRRLPVAQLRAALVASGEETEAGPARADCR